jgi:ABC-type branched-subunit amino acid transport system substrate-binding protein
MRKTFFLLAAVLFLAGCGGIGGRPNYPDSLTPEAQQVWNKAESLYQSGRFNEADAAYKRFIDTFGYNSLTDDARFKRGEISFNKKNYSEALEFYRSAYSNIYSPSISPRAQFKAAYSLYQLKRHNDAIDEVSKIRRLDASAVLRARADSVGVLSSKAVVGSDPIRFYLFLLDDYMDLSGNSEALKGVPDLVSETEALSEVRRWIGDDKVTSAQMAALPLKEYKGKRSGGYAQFKYGKALNSEGEFGRATKELKAYVSAYPKHEYYGAATALLGETAGRAGEAAVKVGLILPLSGKYQIYGESVLHGVECAVGVYAPCEGSGNAALVIKDVDGQPENIVAAVDELASANVIAIIGPMLSATVQAAAERAEQLQIPMVTLSQRKGITDAGNFIFRNTVAADSQVTTIVDYAVGRKRIKRFMILYPQSEQGREYKDLFSEAVRQGGGKVTVARGYSSNSVELASDLRSMSLESDGGKNFDAIFIPDSFGAAGFLATTLAGVGVEGVQYLGISRWDDQRLITAGGKYVEGAVFPEAFYKKSQDPNVSTFVSRFTQAYGIEPTLLEALGYDSMRMILEAVKGGAAHRATLKDALARLTDYQGVTGRTSFNANRDATRELPLLTVSGGEIKPLTK